MVRAPRRESRGFTLIEVLVVVTIIAILAGLTMPVLAKARAKGRSAACMSNLGQLGKAMLMYSDDYDGRLPQEWYPGSDGYPGALSPYVGNDDVYICPEQGEDVYTSYGMPAWAAYEVLWSGAARLQTAGSGATTILLAENWYSFYSSRDPVHWPSRWWPELGNIAWERHQGGANYLLADGHVKRLTRAQTYGPECMWWAWAHPGSGECRGRNG